MQLHGKLFYSADVKFIIMKTLALCMFVFLMSVVNAQTLTVTSPDFENGGEIPERFTCDGDDTNPNLMIAGIPKDTKSLAIIMEDPDVALTTFNHWLVWNIPPQEVIRATTEEKEYQIKMLRTLQSFQKDKAATSLDRIQQAAIQNKNIFGELMEATKVCSLGQITKALFEVGGQYRRNM